jgi:hypothetical protein
MATPLNRLNITLATHRMLQARVIHSLGGGRRQTASQDHFVKIPFSSALDHSGMINGQSNEEIRNMEDAWRRPRADAGSFSVVAADRIGGDPRQLDLWPSPPSKNGAFKAVQAALDGWKPFKRATDKAQPGQGPDHSAQPKFLLLDPIGVPAPKPAPGWDEIAVADRDEFVAPAPSIVIRAFRPAVVAAGLVAALALGGAGGWGSYHAFAPAPASVPLERTSVADCALGSGQDSGCAAAKSDREAAQAAAPLQKAAVSAANGAGRGHEPARAAPHQAAPAPTRDASTAQPAAASPTTTGAISRERARMSPRPVPVPETRPTTIEGWTVREVVGGTVVLEGPDGVWRAARGETVPGVGRVDSIVRWGNRWIVATSRGLISTPN